MLDRHVAFLNALREAGLPVSLAEGLDAARAVTEVDLLDREALRAGYAATVVKRHAHRDVFDALFDLWFPAAVGDGVAPAGSAERSEPTVEVTGGRGAAPEVQDIRADLAASLLDGDDGRLDQLARTAVAEFGREPGSGAWSPRRVIDTLTPRTLMAGLMRTAMPIDDLSEQVARRRFATRIARFEQRVSDEARRRIAEDKGVAETAKVVVRPPLERVDFLAATRADLAAMRREIYPLSRRLATRISMRHRRGRRGPLDFRRTIRRSLSTGGVPLTTRHKPRRPHKPELVILCDVSSSVAAFARFALLLVYALREQFTKVRAFAFVDTVEEVTRFFDGGADADDALAAMAAESGLRWMGGGTNYGRVFDEFAGGFPDAIGPKTALLVLGDARTNYTDPSVGTLADLVRRARHAYWLNPEPEANWATGDSATAGYAEVVEMFECRNLSQLADFVRELA